MYTYGKRLIDQLVSISLFVLLLPVFCLLVLLLSIQHKGKLFFIQSRPGQNGKLFKIIKFKTMSDKRSFIRKSSLDEVPQLLNVMKGEMSLIGPRPLLPEYLDLYNNFQRRRHEVKPGITGWAQVNGRNAISWKQKFAYDVWYVEHLSLRLDLQIAWLTVARVLQGADINQKGQATTIYFTGNKN